MIIDMTGYLGHWPFRKIENNDVDSFLRVMDAYEIDHSVVTSLDAVFYKDVMQGNEKLANDIAPHRDRLSAFAVINPSYVAWEKDLKDCVERLDMKGVMMLPYYHRYSLKDANATALARLAANMGIPVHIPVSIVNVRQRHWMDTNDNLENADFLALIKNAPDTDFLVSNGPTHALAAAVKPIDQKRAGRVCYDFSRVEVFLGQLDALIEHAGIDNIMLGTGNPLQVIDPQWVKIHYANITDEQRQAILWKNAAAWLNLRGS